MLCVGINTLRRIMKKEEVIIPIRLDEEFITNMKSGNNHSSDYYQKIIIDYLDRRESMAKVDDYILEFNNLTADDIEDMNVYQIEQLEDKLRFVDNQLSRNINSVKSEDTIVVNFYVNEDCELTTKEISDILNC